MISRVDVAVNEETVDMLQRIIVREGVTVTEAFRRLVGYGDVLYRAAKDDDAVIEIRTPAWTSRLIIL